MATLERVRLPVGARSLTCLTKYGVLPDATAELRILLHFALDGECALTTFPFSLVADEFIRRGGVAASFDLPCHGEKARREEEGIAGLSLRIRRGEDPFAEFLEEAKAVLDHCSERFGGRPITFVVSGTSRGGYTALRLMASDARITRAAAFAPVTDWAALEEFGWARETERLEAFKLTAHVDALAGRPIFLDILSDDPRVDTGACRRFYQQLSERNKQKNFPPDLVKFQFSEGVGHDVSEDSYHQGAAFLWGQ